MQTPLREIATVILRGGELPGISFYALFQQPLRDKPAFPVGVWPVNTELHLSRLRGDGWLVLVWDVALSSWPSTRAFQDAVSATFEQLIHASAKATWIGREGYFCDPPDLFSPDCMSGGVLAVALPDGRTWGTPDPEQPLVVVDDAVLLEVRRATSGLSDVGQS